jgi:hypothetical protein
MRPNLDHFVEEKRYNYGKYNYQYLRQLRKLNWRRKIERSPGQPNVRSDRVSTQRDLIECPDSEASLLGG